MRSAMMMWGIEGPRFVRLAAAVATIGLAVSAAPDVAHARCAQTLAPGQWRIVTTCNNTGDDVDYEGIANSLDGVIQALPGATQALGNLLDGLGSLDLGAGTSNNGDASAQPGNTSSSDSPRNVFPPIDIFANVGGSVPTSTCSDNRCPGSGTPIFSLRPIFRPVVTLDQARRQRDRAAERAIFEAEQRRARALNVSRQHELHDRIAELIAERARQNPPPPPPQQTSSHPPPGLPPAPPRPTQQHPAQTYDCGRSDITGIDKEDRGPPPAPVAHCRSGFKHLQTARSLPPYSPQAQDEFKDSAYAFELVGDLLRAEAVRAEAARALEEHQAFLQGEIQRERAEIEENAWRQYRDCAALDQAIVADEEAMEQFIKADEIERAGQRVAHSARMKALSDEANARGLCGSRVASLPPRTSGPPPNDNGGGCTAEEVKKKKEQVARLLKMKADYVTQRPDVPPFSRPVRLFDTKAIEIVADAVAKACPKFEDFGVTFAPDDCRRAELQWARDNRPSDESQRRLATVHCPRNRRAFTYDERYAPE
ncbi:MAG TPA: hypothetical protein VKX28_24225 [Xanthobacteraceae bacterium]|nr:hypothetical protein [Xanthobacteraceae bacterium]